MRLLCVCVLLGVTLPETSGFITDACDIHHNSRTCSNHGDLHPCKQWDKCECYSGWSGSACDTQACHTEPNSNHCNHHGTYETCSQQCTCDSGWTGGHCETQDCHTYQSSNHCNHHGTYETCSQHCTCDSGWTGGHCETQCQVYHSSSHHCNTHGDFNTCTQICTCHSDYAGSTCETPTSCRTLDCGLHGHCSTHNSLHCSCQPGFHGDRCQEGQITTVTTTAATTTPTTTPTTTKTTTTSAPLADGLWTAWSSWICTKTCGNGVNVRTRICVYIPGLPRGQPCTGDTTDFAVCTNQACPVASIATTTTTSTTAATTVTNNWGPWGAWSTCSASCGQSSRSRVRTCFLPSGQLCHGSFQEAEMCNIQSCPLTSDWGTWTPWSTCSTTCGQSARIRTRSCDLPSGQLCHGSFQEAEICSKPACPYWGPFHDTSSCSVTCGTGAIEQERECSTGNSQDCTGSAFTEKPCVLQDCVFN